MRRWFGSLGDWYIPFLNTAPHRHECTQIRFREINGAIVQNRCKSNDESNLEHRFKDTNESCQSCRRKIERHIGARWKFWISVRFFRFPTSRDLRTYKKIYSKTTWGKIYDLIPSLFGESTWLNLILNLWSKQSPRRWSRNSREPSDWLVWLSSHSLPCFLGSL